MSRVIEVDDAAAAEANPTSETAGDDDTPALEARFAVFGDSDFAANSAVGIQGNQDLALNAINWLAQQDNLIAIRPRVAEDRRITLTADQQFRVQLLSLLMIPGLVLGLGVFTWWNRRKH